jgi:O-antigen/teichoic acid export membrane protein
MQNDPPIATLEPSVNPPTQSGLFFKPFDSSGEFILTAQGKEVRRLAVRGAGATTLAQALGLFVQIGSTLILARLLTPTDFGLVTMVTTFSLLFMNAGGNGFTEAILQRKDLDHALASNLFWINVSTGLALTIVFASAGTLMAKFYGNPKVVAIAVGLSLTIFITSTTVLHLALLMRAMRFPVVYANQIFARFVSLAVTIMLAIAGWGYWSLVGGAIMQPLTECIGAWTLCRWIPGRPRRVAATGSMVRFALHVYGRFSFNYFARNVDNLLVGWRFNAQSLGFYKKAYDLFALSSILQAFTPVAVSALSRLNQDPEQYKKHLLKALSVWAFLGMGVGGAITLVGKDLIRVLLGAKWGPSGEVFTYFGPGFGIMFIYGIHGWIHLSLGRPGRWFKWGIIEFVVTGLMFVIALPWGPVGVAAAWSVSLLILTIPSLLYAGKPINLGLGAILSPVWRFVVASLLAGGATAVLVGWIFTFAVPAAVVGAIVRLAIISLLFGLLYTGVVVLLHRSWAPLMQVVNLVREMLARRRSAQVPTMPEATPVANQQ